MQYHKALLQSAIWGGGNTRTSTTVLYKYYSAVNQENSYQSSIFSYIQHLKTKMKLKQNATKIKVRMNFRWHWTFNVADTDYHSHVYIISNPLLVEQF